MRRRINYTQLYAQAIALLDRGEQYWLDENQTRRVMESNRRFQSRSPEEAFFHECFRLPTNQDEGQWMTATAILYHVQHHAGIVPRASAISSLRGDSVRSFGRFLSSLPGIVSRHSRLGTEYLVVMLGI